MKKIITSSFIILIITQFAFGQFDSLYLFKRNCKFGFIDKNGKEVIAPIYDRANNFTEGLAGACINNKCGYINKKGKTEIPFIYFNVGEFYKGLASVSIKDQFDQIYINHKGSKPTTSPFFTSYDLPDNWELFYNYETSQRGIMNASNEIILPAKYNDIGYYHDGFSIITANNRSGFINSKGNIIVDAKYYFLSDFNEGLAYFKRDSINNTYGYIDTSGLEIINDTLIFYGDYDSFVEVDINDSLIFIDQLNFSEGLAACRYNNKFGYIDTKGRWIIKPIYDNALPFSGGLGRVSINKKWGMINMKNQFLIPPKYETLFVFSEGLAAFKLNNKWGFINKQDKVILQPEFDDAWYFYKGLAPVFINGEYTDYFQYNCDDKHIKLFYINKEGKIVWKQK